VTQSLAWLLSDGYLSQGFNGPRPFLRLAPRLGGRRIRESPFCPYHEFVSIYLSCSSPALKELTVRGSQGRALVRPPSVHDTTVLIQGHLTVRGSQGRELVRSLCRSRHCPGPGALKQSSLNVHSSQHQSEERSSGCIDKQWGAMGMNVSIDRSRLVANRFPYRTVTLGNELCYMRAPSCNYCLPIHHVITARLRRDIAAGS